MLFCGQSIVDVKSDNIVSKVRKSTLIQSNFCGQILITNSNQ